MAKLRERLGAGAKRLAGNRGFRRYPAEDEGEGGRGFRIDEDRIADEERFDGVWALRVKAPLGATEAALKYKELWRVERCFRESKSLLRTRPVFHRTDEAIRGHVFRSFLALVLRQDLQRRLREVGAAVEWADLIRGLARLQEMMVAHGGERGGEAGAELRGSAPAADTAPGRGQRPGRLNGGGASRSSEGTKLTTNPVRWHPAVTGVVLIRPCCSS